MERRVTGARVTINALILGVVVIVDQRFVCGVAARTRAVVRSVVVVTGNTSPPPSGG